MQEAVMTAWVLSCLDAQRQVTLVDLGMVSWVCRTSLLLDRGYLQDGVDFKHTAKDAKLQARAKNFTDISEIAIKPKITPGKLDW